MAIRVIVCRVGCDAVVEEIEPTLAAMQTLVGGYIERLILDEKTDLWCNEEGLLKELPYNRNIAGHRIVGDFFLASHDNEGETTTLTDAQIETWLKAMPPSSKFEVPPRMSADDLAKFVADFIEGRIFTSAQIRDPDLTANIFMPIAFGAFAGMTRDDAEQIGCVWEYLDQAGPTAINGYPIFFSCRLMRMEDWQEAKKRILAARDAVKKFSKGDYGSV